MADPSQGDIVFNSEEDFQEVQSTSNNTHQKNGVQVPRHLSAPMATAVI